MLATAHAPRCRPNLPLKKFRRIAPMKEQKHFSIAQALVDAAQILRQASIPDERREAASLLGHVIGRDRTYILTRAEQALTPLHIRELREVVRRRAAGEPFQYITGHQEFYSLDFAVSPAVLIPRPETELLVEKGLEVLQADTRPAFICDVGTGSGCIAIALLYEHKAARGIGLDISAEALTVAHRNAAQHQMLERLQLLQSDGFAALPADTPPFTLIVSNPPYIPAADIQGLQVEVREHEPHSALTPGPDGLAMVRRLLHEAAPRLASHGHLLIEIGYDQAAAVRAMIDPRTWQLIDIYRDLQGHERTIALRKVQ